MSLLDAVTEAREHPYCPDEDGHCQYARDENCPGLQEKLSVGSQEVPSPRTTPPKHRSTSTHSTTARNEREEIGEMTLAIDTLKEIAEDTFLLAANIRTGEALDEEEHTDDLGAAEARRNWRIIELVVNLGERMCATAGLELSEVWVPTDIQDMLDVKEANEPA